MSVADDSRTDICEQIVRSDRFIAEPRTRQSEQSKLNAGGRKLEAEARTFNRDRWFVLASAVFAVLAGPVACLPGILHAFGVGR